MIYPIKADVDRLW